jgi:ADP-ribose pyrophosphatase YjhB (NUDIX family)
MGEVWHGLRAVARVLIANEAGELLLCRSRSGSSWVPPGGTLDPGETLPVAAVREAAEEAGVAVELGALAYVMEYRPPHRNEHVVTAAFHARAHGHAPTDAGERARPAGPPGRPWAAWFIQDVDGPLREVRWFTREALAAVPEPVYPAFLRDRYWEAGPLTYDPYLGMVTG